MAFEMVFASKDTRDCANLIKFLIYASLKYSITLTMADLPYALVGGRGWCRGDPDPCEGEEGGIGERTAGRPDSLQGLKSKGGSKGPLAYHRNFSGLQNV